VPKHCSSSPADLGEHEEAKGYPSATLAARDAKEIADRRSLQ
jgi:hypothetical protein